MAGMVAVMFEMRITSIMVNVVKMRKIRRVEGTLEMRTAVMIVCSIVKEKSQGGSNNV